MQEMEVWPSDVGLRGQASNRPVPRWLKTVVASDREKVRLDRIRWGPGRRARSARAERAGRASLSKRRYYNSDIETGDLCPFPGMSLAGARLLARRCPAQRRREPGLQVLHGT